MRILLSRYFLLVIAFFTFCLVALFFLTGNEEITSTLHAETKPIFLPENGRVVRWHVKKGDRVKKGDLLFEMDSIPLERKKKKIEKELLLSLQKKKVSQIEIDQKSMAYIQTKQEWSLGKKSKEEVDFSLKELEHAQALLDLASAEKELLETSLQLLDEEIISRKVQSPCNGIIQEIYPFSDSHGMACILHDLSHLSFSIDTRWDEDEIKEKFDLIVSSLPQKKFSYQVSHKKDLANKKFHYQFYLSEEDSSVLFPDMEIILKKKK